MPSSMKRMALAYPLESKPETFSQSVFEDCFGSIFRAAREKTAAVAEKRADGSLVGAD